MDEGGDIAGDNELMKVILIRPPQLLSLIIDKKFRAPIPLSDLLSFKRAVSIVSKQKIVFFYNQLSL